MKAIEFPHQTTVMAKDQPEYNPMPAFRGRIPHSDFGGEEVVGCYQLSDAEIEKLIKTRVIWLRFLTWDGPLQPHLPTVDNPFNADEHTK